MTWSSVVVEADHDWLSSFFIVVVGPMMPIYTRNPLNIHFNFQNIYVRSVLTSVKYSGIGVRCKQMESFLCQVEHQAAVSVAFVVEW